MRRAVIAILLLLLLAMPFAWRARWRVDAALPCVIGRWQTDCRTVLARLSDGSTRELRCVLSDRREPVALRSDTFRLAGDLFRPRDGGNGEAIVLLHGASSFGRRLPLVRILADRLRRRGYTVLAIDLRGFGESQKPADVNAAGAFDYATDVRAAIDHLRNGAAPAARVHVIGHSFGGGVALLPGARDPRIATLVLIGPPRRIEARFLVAGAPDSAYFVERARDDMQLAATPRYEVWAEVFGAMDIGRYTSDFSMPDHPPLLLVDSEREDPEDLAFLRRVHRSMSPHVEHWTLPDTDHYLNTGLVRGRPCYHGGIVGDFVDRLDAWLRAAPATGASR